MHEPEITDLDLALDLASDVAALNDELLGGVNLTSPNRLQLVMAGKALRSRVFFMSIIELARARYAGPATALIRCLMEIQYVVEAIAKNPDWIVDLISGDDKQRLRGLRIVKNLPADVRASSIDAVELDEAIANINPDSASRQVFEWAQRAGRELEYRMAYTLLSVDVHASLRSAEAHLVVVEPGKVCGLLALPEQSELPYRLVSACDSMLCILRSMPDEVVPHPSHGQVDKYLDDRRKHSINIHAAARMDV